jgi:hypothetical protein
MEDDELDERHLNGIAFEIERLYRRWSGPTEQYPTFGLYLSYELHGMLFLRNRAELDRAEALC